jgi:hypothetical protein
MLTTWKRINLSEKPTTKPMVRPELLMELRTSNKCRPQRRLRKDGQDALMIGPNDESSHAGQATTGTWRDDLPALADAVG